MNEELPMLTLSTHALRQQQLKAEREAVEQKYEGVGIWDMSKRLDAAYHIFNDFNGSFTPDPNFSLEAQSERIKQLSPYVQEAVNNHNPKSLEEFEHVISVASELEQSLADYAQMGITGFGAHVLSLLRDPAAMAINLGTGYIGVGARVVQGGRVAKIAAEAVAAESIVAGARLANNPVYTAEDAAFDIALSPVTAVLPTYLGRAVSPFVMKSRRIANEANNALRDHIKSQATKSQDELTEDVAQVLPRDDYKSSMVKWRLDRFAKYARSLSATVRDVVKRAFDDPVGSLWDKVGQGATAEGVAVMHRDFIIPRYHRDFNLAWNELKKEQGLDGSTNIFAHKKKMKVLNESVRRIILAKEWNDFSDLTRAEIKLANAIDEAIERAWRTANEAGVTFAKRFKHSNNYWPIYYNKGRILGLPKKDVIKLFTQSFMKGAERDGLSLTDNEAKLLAKSMYNKVTQANTVDSVADLLDDPELFFKALNEDALEEGVSKDIIKGLLEKYKGTTEKHFKRRAHLDRTVSITTEDGKELRMVDLMDADPIGVVHRYINRMTGHAGMAKGLGIVDDVGWQELRRKASQEAGREALDELDEIRAVIFGYPTHDVSRKVAQAVTTMNNYMTGVALGSSGWASLPDIAIQTFRLGLAATAKAMPWSPKSMKSKNFEALMDMAALHQIGIESPYLSSMYSQMAEEAVDGLEESIVSKGARNMANITIRAALLSGITEWTQKTAFYGGVVDSFRKALKGKDIPFAKAETGWTTAEHARMRELLANSKKLTVTDRDVERTLEIPDLLSWSPKDRETFLRGMYRYSLRAASRSTRGESIAFFEHPLARVVLLFRSIVFGSITKRALSGLTRIGTGLGAKVTAISFLAQASALYLMSYLKHEAKMLGMDDASRNKYVKRLGFDNLRHYQRFYSGDIDAILDASGKVHRAIMGYSPSVGGLIELVDITASLFGEQLMGGTRYKPVEETIFSSPVASYAENIGRLIFNGWDGEITKEEANRFKSLMWMNSHPVVSFTSNKIIEEAGLKDK